MKNPSKFWDKIANRYAKQAVADEASYQKKLTLSQQYFQPDMQLLELGCGTGSTAIAHASHVKHILALDFSQTMIEIARNKAKQQQISNIHFEQSNIEALKLEASSMDAVLAMSVLHLVDDKSTVLQQTHSLLKENGIFISSTICLQDDLWWLKFIFPLGKALRLIPQVNFFTQAQLEQSIRQQGFKIEHCWRPAKRKATFIIARKI